MEEGEAMDVHTQVGVCKYCCKCLYCDDYLDSGVGLACSEACAAELVSAAEIEAFNARAVADFTMSSKVYLTHLNSRKKLHMSALLLWCIGFFIALSHALAAGDADYGVTFCALFTFLGVFSIVSIGIQRRTIGRLVRDINTQ